MEKEIDKVLSGELIGKEESVLNHIEEDYRIVSRDEVDYVVTCDYKSERLNIKIVNGIITEITCG